jgi:hsp70-interacting protein
MLEHGGIPVLVSMAIQDSNEAVRRKAIYALSSGIRNFQPGLDEAMKTLPAEFKDTDTVDAGDMEAIDSIIKKLRDAAAKKE